MPGNWPNPLNPPFGKKKSKSAQHGIYFNQHAPQTKSHMNLIALGWRLFINSLAQSIVAKKPTVTFDAMLKKH